MAKKGYVSPLDRIDERLRGLEGEGAEQGTENTAEQEGGNTPNVEQGISDPPSEDTGQTAESQGAPQGEDENSLTYRQRWEALKGILGGERQKVEQLTEQVRYLSQQVQDLRASGNALSSQATVAEITDHLKALQEEYGEDYTVALRNAIRGEATQIINEALDKRMKTVDEKLDHVEQESVKDRQLRFAAALEQRVPGWQQMLQTEDWALWLAGTRDPLSGASLRDLFLDANNKWDIDRITAILNSFKQATGRATPQPGNANNTIDPRQRLVTPGRSQGTTAQPQAQPKIWTMAEINAFSRDVTSGRFRGREDEAARIEAEIDRANLEGRIIR